MENCYYVNKNQITFSFYSFVELSKLQKYERRDTFKQ